MSLFTGVLIEGAKGAGDNTGIGNKDGAVTAGELYAYVISQVEPAVLQATGGVQTPTLAGPHREILFIYTRLVVAPPPKAPPPGSPAPAPKKKAAPATGVTPSFDCSKAGTADERAICANADLAVLDRQMADLYYARRQALQGRQRNELVDAQRRWIRRRQACRGNVACMTIIYRQWIKSLQ